MAIIFVRISGYSDSWKSGNQLPAEYNGIHAVPIAESELRDLKSSVYPDKVEIVNVTADNEIYGLLFSEVDEYVTGFCALNKRWGSFVKIDPKLPEMHKWDVSMVSFVQDGTFIAEWQVIIK